MPDEVRQDSQRVQKKSDGMERASLRRWKRHVFCNDFWAEWKSGPSQKHSNPEFSCCL